MIVCALSLGVTAGAHPAGAQAPPADSAAADTSSGVPAWSEDAWTEITTYDGVRFTYIRYRQADNENDGVVVRLQNQNDYPVRYAFTVVFRTATAERTARTRGELAAGEMETGDKDGLFWIPFKDGQAIVELGLRRLRIVPDRS